jgi:hypothetical protein
MTRGGAAFGRPPKPEPPTLVERVKALRHRPRRLALLALLVVLLGFAWVNRASETWITAAPLEMSLAVGASQELTVALKYKPPFLWRGTARSIAGTIQLISFPTAVDVAPTTVVSTDAQPEAVMKVTGLRAGMEELDLAASNRPADQRSWRTGSIRVTVAR